MSRTVGILFVFWFCIFSVSEAALGASCNETDTSNCTATNEKCIDDSCKCSTGYFNVSNTCNSSSITVTLTTQSISVVYGSNVTLIASITSEVPLNTSNTFKWLKGPTDGSLIEFVLTPSKYTQNDVGQVTLTIQNVNFTDTGAYQVKVGNIAGTTNTSNQVSINVTGERPTVVVPGTITEINTAVTIHCTASGSPALTSVYWLLNATNLDISDSTKYTGGTVSNPSLSIHNIASTDAGEYRCVATNLVGSTNSTKSVTLAPPSSVSISQQPANPVYNGTRITVSGSYTSTLLNVKGIKWQRMNGNAFSDIDITADKYKESTDKGSNPTLVITKVDFTDRTSFRLTVSNGVGIMSSEAVYLNVIDGSISVTLTPPSSSARLGSDVILTAMITSTASVNLTKWQKVLSGGNPENLDISLPKYTQNDVGQGTVTLTIHNVTFTDMGAYQVEVSNAAGNTGKSNQVSFSVRAGQFNESCTNQQPCDTSQNLECTTINRCRCTSAFYYKDQVCNEKSGLVPINIGLNSTTSGFSVFWNNPTTDDYELVSGYEVNWKVPGGSWKSSNQLDRTVNKYTPSSNLIPGQLYTVKVISHVTLTNPADSFVVTSSDTTVRTVPLAPGSIVTSQSNFTHNDLQIKWTAPVNTVVTKYEVILNDTTYTTMSNDTMYHFNGKVFVPGKSYVISIVTVSGTTSDIVKKSSEHTEWIRTTPTKPNPPTNLQCPQSPLDVSLEISWTAPVKPNGLILGYQIDVSPGNLQFYTSSNETHKNVEGLLPEQMYTFAVRTINDAVDNTSESNQSLTCKTKAGVSTSPTNLNIDEIQSRGFRIQFNRPDNVSGVLAAYKILISQGGDCVQQILVYGNCSNCKSTVDCQLINYTVPNITNNNVSYTAGGLMPYTHYMVKVVAINGKGEGHPVNETVTTDEEVPLQPEQITASNIQPNSLTLTWTLPDPSPGNTTYTIYTYEGTDDVGKSFLMNKSTKVYGFDTKTLSVTGLEEYWPYKFNVTATTVKGDNTSDFSSVFRTKQAAPGQVLNLTIDQRGSDYKAAYVSWSPPALRDHNGVLESYLFSSNHTGTMEVKEMSVLSQATVEKKIPVTPEAVYVIEVILKNNENMESQPSIQTYKAPAGPPPVTNIEPVSTSPGEQPTTNTLTIDINTEYFKNDENGKQVFFGIAVCAKSKCEDKTVMAEITLQHDWKDLPNWHMASKDGFPLYRVTNDTFMDKVRKGDSRWKRSTINASVIKFKIGEDAACPFLNANVYCNGHLSAGISYNVIIFACTNGGCTYSEADGAFSTQRIPEEEDTNINIIIGVVVAVVVAAVIVGVAFVVVKRRNRLGETKQYTKGIENPSTFDEPVPKNIPRKRPIKLKELCDKVAEKHKDSNLHFAREYEDLKALSPKHPAETSELDSNKLKNRYVNILPFDHSRVKLMLTEDDDPSTDFINANYLPGYKSQREYIATQGPIPGTIDDFWRMIWEQNVSIIVMLTLCKEEGRVKCEMYWPENIHEPKQYGDLVVETVSNSTVNFYEFRIFKIKLGDTTRSVKHFHFLQWKDFSANVQNDVMIDFIKNVRNHIRPPDMNGPVVVHCSAGVGRTGTYCALDHLFQFVDEHDLDESIDIFDLVMNLRERRMFMVQTEQQYIFIHDCLKDYLEKKLSQGKDECLYENQAFVADEDPMEESLYQNYSNQRTDL